MFSVATSVTRFLSAILSLFPCCSPLDSLQSAFTLRYRSLLLFIVYLMNTPSTPRSCSFILFFWPYPHSAKYHLYSHSRSPVLFVPPAYTLDVSSIARLHRFIVYSAQSLLFRLLDLHLLFLVLLDLLLFIHPIRCCSLRTKNLPTNLCSRLFWAIVDRSRLVKLTSICTVSSYISTKSTSYLASFHHRS